MITVGKSEMNSVWDGLGWKRRLYSFNLESLAYVSIQLCIHEEIMSVYRFSYIKLEESTMCRYLKKSRNKSVNLFLEIFLCFLTILKHRQLFLVFFYYISLSTFVYSLILHILIMSCSSDTGSCIEYMEN